MTTKKVVLVVDEDRTPVQWEVTNDGPTVPYPDPYRLGALLVGPPTTTVDNGDGTYTHTFVLTRQEHQSGDCDCDECRAGRGR